jgi:DNA-binding winged helix-turn-helix (wHTH) protein
VTHRPPARQTVNMSTRTSRGPRTVRFGEFELDARAGELRSGGERIRLQEQPFRILLMLLERPGEVVLREEIRKRLWPNDTVVEISHGINAAVLRLRDALGESAENPRFIETVARRGYRFRAETAPPPAPPAPSDRYRIVEQIGAGGMGVVYRAEDLRLGREVALKLLPRDMTYDAAALGRFQREARAASALTHPNICTIYNVEEHLGQPAIAMVLLEGETLEAVLARGPLPIDKALALAIPIVSALDAAHRKGIAHRDLKPANILITPAGVKVLDFGLAKVDRPAAFESRVTERGAILGTLHYMSPEQAQGKDAGPASDIFSFGVVLYEMLSGRRPFDGENSATVMASILKSDPARLRNAALWRIVERCLAKDPEARWQSAGDLKTALEWTKAPAARARTLHLHWPQVSWRPGRRTAIFAVLAVAASLAGFVVSHLPAPVPARIAIAGHATHPSLSPDGTRIAYRVDGHLFVRVLGEETPRAIPAADGGASNTPFWSPDGRSLAFTSGRELQVVSADGGVPRVVAPVNTTLSGAWGPDGTILLGLLGDGIYRIPSTGGVFTRVTTVNTAANETRHMLPQFLPDGRHFLYTAGSSRAGESMIYGASLDSGESKPIVHAESNARFVPSRRGGSQGYLVFERDGALIAYAFDAAALRLSGGAIQIAPSVAATPTIASAARVADFSATPATIAWRSTGPGGSLVVQTNWVGSIPR